MASFFFLDCNTATKLVRQQVGMSTPWRDIFLVVHKPKTMGLQRYQASMHTDVVDLLLWG